VPDGDPSFGDLTRWHYFNTNNVWFDLSAIAALQADDPAAPELPLIVNRKTVDPTDKSSTPVIQLETAMGAAVSSVAGAAALEVPRTRFAPVKTTDDLLVARSDLWELREDGAMIPHFDPQPPVISLDKAHFGMLRDFEARFPAGAPSLRDCVRLEVRGDVTFTGPTTVRGTVVVDGPAEVSGTLEG
jgi:UTP--glucose-1-phosphate uridylyltransferase